ncbi:MAG: RcnB family protein, partial [Pseudomonadota bacterium]
RDQRGDLRDFRRDRRDDRRDFRADRRDDRRDYRDNRRDWDRREWDRRGWADRGWNGRDWDRRGWDGRGRGWDRGWRNDRRYDWYGWRNQNRAFFNVGRYYPPVRGWNYRRLGIGFTLGAPFFASSFWINDPWAYRLPPAYGQYRWVRYYGDVLLVDIYTGQVVDVINDFFW